MATRKGGRWDPEACRFAPILRSQFAPMLPAVKGLKEALVSVVSWEHDRTLIVLDRTNTDLRSLKPPTAGCSTTVPSNQAMPSF